MAYFQRLRRKQLTEILVDEGVASKEAVATALHEHKQRERLLTDVLIDGNELTEYDLARVLVAQYQLPFVDLATYTLHRDLMKQYPPDLLHRAGLVPLDRFGETVCFACQEYPDEEVLKELEQKVAGNVYFFVALAMEVRQALHDHVPREAGEELPEKEPAKVPLDTAWAELFDAANESVLSGLQPDESEADVPAKPFALDVEPDENPPPADGEEEG